MKKTTTAFAVICLVVLLALPAVSQTRQTRRFRASENASSVDPARIKQLRQEIRTTKDPKRRMALNREIMQLQTARLKNFRGLRFNRK